MKFRKYRVIVEADREGREFLGIAVPAINKKKAEEFVAGNGQNYQQAILLIKLHGYGNLNI